MDALVGDLCRRDVAMLGEATHGDGRTLEFKAELVRRLVRECGYDALFFEASHYDFLELERRIQANEPTDQAMLSSSIGGIWNRYREVAPLIQFLFAEARAGRVRLGGLDDQLGTAGAFFSIHDMPARLTSPLQGPRQDQCREAIRRRIYSDYSDTAPYDEAEQIRIRACAAESAAAIRRSRAPAAERRGLLQMLENIGRYLNRDFADEGARTAGRGRSMYLNFRWLAAGLPRRSKIIVWSATVHVAKDPSAAPGFASAPSFGSYVTRSYGPRAFSLGFSAWTGSYRDVFMAAPAEVGIPARGSLEERALAGTDSNTVYRDHAWLVRNGTTSGGVFRHSPTVAPWHRILDGLIVFRAERPPSPV
jgi:erythromycin esterase-like protein